MKSIDGAYYTEDISNKASEKNINLIPINLVGRSQSSEKSGYEKFEIDENTHKVNSCPAGHKPEDSKYNRGVYRAYFSKDKCGNCPYRANCPVSEQKKMYLLEASETKRQ